MNAQTLLALSLSANILLAAHIGVEVVAEWRTNEPGQLGDSAAESSGK